MFLALAYLISRCSLAQFIASMESYSLQFDPGAFGTPEDWNSRVAYATWNRRQAQHYEPGSFPVSPSERLADFYTLLDCRSDREGLPLSRRFGPALEVESNWFRLPWLSSGGDGVIDALESEGWVRAWHGTKLEALYSQIYFGRLFSSSSVQQGERFFSGSPGVYLHKDSTKHKAGHYMRFVQLAPSRQFFAIKWEVRTHRNYRVTVSRQTDQWVQQPNSVILVALWVCSCHLTEMKGGLEFSPAWHPLLEANPYWPQTAARAAQEDQPLNPAGTFAEQLPMPRPPISPCPAVPQLGPRYVAGTFDWHFGEDGQAPPEVRQLYKEACRAMSNLNFPGSFTDT